jgi:hypothetical protein
MSSHGASAGRAEKRASGDGLTMPASAGVIQSRRPISWADRCFARQWRISASAAGSPCDAFFELTLSAGRIAKWPDAPAQAR